ncbi:LysM peptidoglycan-binding domain-containing protein [Aeromicrobium sp.]|uniref:LysM peptidoglycan-binding domain-containing protein n=1 Tax=Aeromicrobium sp. TaxID=1871063 RepID=UPI002FC7965A
MFLSRSGWVLAALAAASVWLIAPDLGATFVVATGRDFPQALLAIASLVQLAVACWVLFVICVSRSSSRLARALTPALMRRALFAGAAGALALTPVHAERVNSPARHQLDGLRLPDRPVTSGATSSSIVVRPGDTLWAIAARSLPPGATDSEIASACARWYATNRAVIGADPDLIHPQQRLTPPSKTPPSKDVP